MKNNQSRNSIADSLDEFYQQLANKEKPRLQEFFARHVDSSERMFYLHGLVVSYLESRVRDGKQPLCVTALFDELPEFSDDINQLPLDELEPEFLMPEKIDGYRITEFLDKGGQGLVYAATSINKEGDGVDVVIKFANQRGRDSSWLGVEGKHLRKLKNTAFPALHGFGKYRNRPFIAMQRIAADSFTKWVEGSELGTKPKVAVLRQIALAVEHMHEKKIVHRDLGPQNIMISKHSFQPVIFDFGLAVSIDVWENPENKIDYLRTGKGGSLGYMPPEQALADPKSDGVKCDVFQLGALLLYAFTEEPLFAGFDREERLENTSAYRVNEAAIAGFRKEVPRLASILDVAIAKDPKSRFQSAAAFASALEEYESSLSPLPKPWFRQNSTVALCIASAVIALLSISLFLMNREPSPNKMPAALAALCRDNGVDLTKMSKEDFEVHVELHRHAKNPLPHDYFGLRGEYGPRFHLRFKHNPAVPLFPAFRVFPREWRSGLVDVVRDKKWDGVTYYGDIDVRDLDAEGPLQVSLSSHSYEDGRYVVGPFDFDKDIRQAIEEAYQKKEAEEIAAAKDLPLLEYQHANGAAVLGRWKLSNEALEHRYAYAKIKLGESKGNLNRVINLGSPGGVGSKNFSWHGESYYPDELTNQEIEGTKGLEFAEKIYAKAEWIDGSESDIRVFDRDGPVGKESRWTMIKQMMDKLNDRNGIAYVSVEENGASGICLNFSKAAKFIERIEYGETPSDLDFEATVSYRKVISKGDADNAALALKNMDIDNGFVWSVVDVFPQNALPFPTYWRNIYFRAVSNDGQLSDVYCVKNTERRGFPGVRLICDDKEAPQVHIGSVWIDFRLFWYSKNKGLKDMAWEGGRELSGVGGRKKPNVKTIRLDELNERLSFVFWSKNGTQLGPYEYRFPEGGLKAFLTEKALADQPVLSIFGLRVLNASNKSIQGYGRRVDSFRTTYEVAKSLFNDRDKPVKRIQGIFAEPLSIHVRERYQWAALKEIRLGKTKDSLNLVHKVDIPVATLANGNPQANEPALVAEVPAEWQAVWASFVFRDGTELKPFELSPRVIDLKPYEE